MFFEKDALQLTPAEVAKIAFWLGLPWGMKMVAGVASDAYPIFGSRRGSYLLLGASCSLVGYAGLATVVDTKVAFLLANLLVTVGFMIQDVVADALSVEVARNDTELGQIQTLGRMAETRLRRPYTAFTLTVFFSVTLWEQFLWLLCTL